MQIELLGSIGIGLVWGWCLGFWNAGENLNRRWLNILISLLASLGLAVLSQALAGWRALLCYAVSVAVSIATYFVWRAQLRRRVTA